MAGGDSKEMYNVVFVLGGPGAGKGTQCQKIQEAFGYIHLSAGDLLRAERQNMDSQYKEEIETCFKNVSIVPVEITCSLLKQEMDKSKKLNFLIDGFPRNKENLDGWDRNMKSVAVVRKVLFFNCPDDVCVARCLKRGKTSGRDDDNVETLKKRIASHTASTMPIIEHFKRKDLVAEIQANQSSEKVFVDVQKVFAELAQ